jgi:serine/threonine protein kinase
MPVSPAAQLNPAQNALPPGSRMGEFEIIGLVGEGGFGIVYLAQDHSLQRRVALKEYMPASLAARNPDGSISVRSDVHLEAFAAGRSSFVNEARLLAQFDHPALVKVFRFWEANGTAYMVMPLYVGKTLRQVLNERPQLEEVWIKRFLAPVLDALEVIHRANCFHRDISPDNLLVLPNEKPVLLDFGAARRVIGDMTQALTVFVKHSYAPIEQYAEMPELKQGAWTDIYTLAALVYLMITRKLPPPSVGRIVQDSYVPLTQCAAGRYSETLLAGIDKCLAVRPENRPQSIPEMRALLGIHTKSSSSNKDAAARPPERKRSSKSRPAPKTWRQQLSENLVPAGAFLTALVALGGFAYYSGQRSVQTPVVPATTISAPVVATQSPVAVAPAAGDASKPAAEAKKPRQTATKPSNTKPKKSQEKDPTIVDAAKNVGKGVKSAAVGIAGWAKRTFGGGSR